MPFPLLLAALAAVAAGTGAKAVAANKADKQQARNVRLGAQEQADKQSEGDELVKQNISKLQKSDAQSAQQSAASQYVQALRARRGSGDAQASILPGASKRYAQGAAQSESAGLAQDARLAGNAAAVDAPLTQRTAEGQGIASTASDLSRLNDQAASLNYLRQLKGSLIRPNAGLNLFGDAAIAAGGALASGGTATGATLGALAGGAASQATTPSSTYVAPQSNSPGFFSRIADKFSRRKQLVDTPVDSSTTYDTSGDAGAMNA